MTHKFTINGKLPSLNEVINEGRTSIRWAARQKKKWTEATAWQIHIQRVPHIIKPIVIRLTWFAKDKCTDPDNICGGGCKILLDALQMAHVIDNDGWQVRGIVNKFKVDKKRPRVECLMREVN
jgi:Holliday junction resolvase RusA-like endonuclease